MGIFSFKRSSKNKKYQHTMSLIEFSEAIKEISTRTKSHGKAENGFSAIGFHTLVTDRLRFSRQVQKLYDIDADTIDPNEVIEAHFVAPWIDAGSEVSIRISASVEDDLDAEAKLSPKQDGDAFERLSRGVVYSRVDTPEPDGGSRSEIYAFDGTTGSVPQVTYELLAFDPLGVRLTQTVEEKKEELSDRFDLEHETNSDDLDAVIDKAMWVSDMLRREMPSVDMKVARQLLEVARIIPDESEVE